MAQKYYELLDDNIPTSQSESYAKSALRNVVRGGLKAGEAVVGLPGDIAQTALNIGELGARGQAQFFNKQRAEKTPPQLPFTSEKLHEVAEKTLGKILPEGYLKPQGTKEELFDEFLSDVAVLAAPGKARVPFVKALGRAGLGQAASFIAKELGFGKGTQTGAKIIAMTLPSLTGGRTALQQKKTQAYKEAKSSLPDKAIKGSNISNELDKLISNVKGRDLRDKSQVIERLEGFKNKIKDGKITPQEIWDSKVELNDWLENTDFSKLGQHYIEEARDLALKELEHYGKGNPKFRTNFKLGEEIHRGLEENSQLTKFLKKYVRLDSVKNPLTKAVLYGATYHKGPGTIIGAAGSAIGARELSEFVDFIKNSPEARKYLGKITTAALKDNSKTIVRDVAKFDQLADEYQGSGKGGYVLLD